MKRFLEIDFQVDGEASLVTLKWELIDEVYALFWFKCLHQLLRKKTPCYFRLTGLNSRSKNMLVLSEQLNTIISLINKNTEYKIKQRADGSFSQEFANAIHHHFEMLYGDAHKPSDLYINSSPLIRSAITKINHIIHDMEALTRAEADGTANKAIVTEFLNRPQYKMADEFLKHFNLNIDFGDLVLHYGIIGKSWWEVFLDQDEEIFDEAIRPLSFMSGEFDIHFSQFHPNQKTKDEFNVFLKKRGLDKSDPKLCLGYLQLAKIAYSSLKKDEIEELLSKELSLNSMRLLEGSRVLEEMNLLADEIAEKGFFQIQPPKAFRSGELIELSKAAVQLIPLYSNKEEVVLRGKVFKRDWDDFEHCVCLMGMSNTQKVVIEPSEGQINVGRVVSLAQGEILELAYNAKDDCYIPVSSKK